MASWYIPMNSIRLPRKASIFWTTIQMGGLLLKQTEFKA